MEKTPKGDPEVWERAGCGRKACGSVGQGSEAESIERKDSDSLTHAVTVGGRAGQKMLGAGLRVITATLLADGSVTKSRAQAPALHVWV